MSFSLSDEHESLQSFLDAWSPGEAEFHQAVTEVMEDIKPIIDQNDDYKEAQIFKRLVEPERVVSFQVAWQNDRGVIEVNRGYRVQFNGSIGAYKGGLRFHPTVNQSVLKFLAFEQTFKNALTGLPMGGGKGGADFNPRGRSDGEIMRFCNAFMQQLYRYIAPDTDVPAGDINVGAREIGYLFGAYRRITNSFSGVLTGKALAYGGSQLRTEATGYGLLYFLEQMLAEVDDVVGDKTLIVSGAGNVATYAAEKAVEMGAKVISLSDSNGFVHDKEGLNQEKIEWVRRYKSETGGSLEAYAGHFGAKWFAGRKPWGLEGNVALPCATQNELDSEDARLLGKNGISVVAEGANMPVTTAGRKTLEQAGVTIAPGKAANAGGVAVSGLEIIQNRQREGRNRASIDDQLRSIMKDIHASCVTEGRRDGVIDYRKGANIAGFRKVADAMVAQGVG